MEWFFPSNNGGQESGFNDAGVETFKGNIDRYSRGRRFRTVSML